MNAETRVAVIIPCHSDGQTLAEAVYSIEEREPVEVVVVNDGSSDDITRDVLTRLEEDGVRVLHHDENLGVSAARMTGLRATRAPFVFPLDADDLAIPGALSALATMLEVNPEAAVCFGDYVEFGDRELIRTVPTSLDPFRIAYTNEYPASALHRRTALDEVAGWRRVSDELDARSDWNLWMTLAEVGARSAHLGRGNLTYARRFHGPRLAAAGRKRHRTLYRAMQRAHPRLFENRTANRRASNLSLARKLLYPLLYGIRTWWPIEPPVNPLLERLGIWTLTEKMRADQCETLASTILGARRAAAGRTDPERKAATDVRVAVVIPCYGDGEFVAEAAHSIDEPEPIEVVIVDDGSTDAETAGVLARLERDGFQVIYHGENRGVAAARMTGVRSTIAPYVFPLDSDDLAFPGAFTAMADQLDANPNAAACYGDYLEFGDHELIRPVPQRLDPFRVAFTNEYPGTCLFRRTALEEVGGWELREVHEDWDLWMALAERGASAAHLGHGALMFRRRVHAQRRGALLRDQHSSGYQILRKRHPQLFEDVSANRKESDLGALWKVLYPVVYGGRPRWAGETRLRLLLEHRGLLLRR